MKPELLARIADQVEFDPHGYNPSQLVSSGGARHSIVGLTLAESGWTYEQLRLVTPRTAQAAAAQLLDLTPQESRALLHPTAPITNRPPKDVADLLRTFARKAKTS